ncbi:hypothetical protein H4CHR_02944 [Variovorax sp. PBS-H4]|uniref:phage protein NinX family protein n=1 Tax=Variovorax sp. PBS-H4 TaxID=434008 RepID=UPI0013189543|nr:phage protein NinX family protein [Variovorax sp. PBS-H4]VTU32108.1 hypothetical protein H4CHR_02944 [Variovorax sp. PBS-H4]
MKVQTSALAGRPLAYAVALADGYEFVRNPDDLILIMKKPTGGFWAWFDNYGIEDEALSIIERERIHLCPIFYNDAPAWQSWIDQSDQTANFGPTAAIAAMRCFVASRLGEEVDIPDELLPAA